MGFFAELKRRNVVRVAGLYAVAAWLLVQVASTVLPAFNAPTWSLRAIIITMVVGFLPALVFAWAFEFTPNGFRREYELDPSQSITPQTGKTLDRIIMVVLALALGYFAFDKFVLLPRREAAAQRQAEANVVEAREQGGVEALVKSYGDRSIAVLPFVNMSSDKEQEYFSDGISEELLNQLAKIPSLRVIARTSSFSFKGKEVDIATIAKTLGVAHILEGSIRKSGNTVRITAQLIRTVDSSHLWSETYDRQMTDIFKVQDEISAAVVAQLKLKLLGAAPKARTTDPQAYALYLLAAQIAPQDTAEALQQSDALYRKVLAIDPRYAPAWTGLALNLYHEVAVGLLSNKEGYAQAREAATTALAIDPDYAPAHARLGLIAARADNDLAGAAQHYERALALDSADLNILENAALLLMSLGRLDEALALEEAIVRRDPVNLSALYNLGYTQRLAGRFDAAIASYRTVLSLRPGLGGVHLSLGTALLLKGDAPGGLAEIEQETGDPWKMLGLPMAYHAIGRKADSDATLAALIAKYEKGGSYNIAYVYAYRGDTDKAFLWLDKAVAYGDPGLGEIVTENLFDNIHKDPRWLPFLRKIGKAPEQLAKIEFKVTLPQNGKP